jgi:hypothetical protein
MAIYMLKADKVSAYRRPGVRAGPGTRVSRKPRRDTGGIPRQASARARCPRGTPLTPALHGTG